ncbi:MAG: SRPBCC family protein [Luteolibacter sp.]|uniref:SRPBCC family protein n=1 Tax=Luteolibacter sp. TaxID=1962973 RepID=UPI0032649ED5
MNNTPKLVYVSTIRTTPTKLWEALTDPDFIQQYWFGRRNTSSWQVGEVIESRSPEGELEWQGKILKCIPEKEVTFSFDTLADESPSTVRFNIEALGEEVQLTITHEDFPEVSAVRDRVSGGWPGIIAGIKSLLETGSAGDLPSPCAAGSH